MAKREYPKHPSLGDPKRLARLLGLSEALPEIEVEEKNGHYNFKVRGKGFAWYLDNHHADGIVALCAKSTLARQQELVTTHPDRYVVPAYVGPSGWVGLRLDLKQVHWDEAAALLVAAYRMQAPRRLAEQVE